MSNSLEPQLKRSMSEYSAFLMNDGWLKLAAVTFFCVGMAILFLATTAFPIAAPLLFLAYLVFVFVRVALFAHSGRRN
jgi:hypothetical protein